MSELTNVIDAQADEIEALRAIEVHDFIPGECNCPRGKVLAMLEVE